MKRDTNELRWQNIAMQAALIGYTVKQLKLYQEPDKTNEKTKETRK